MPNGSNGKPAPIDFSSVGGTPVRTDSSSSAYPPVDFSSIGGTPVPADASVDYDALAQKFGAVSSATPDYDALAAQHGGTPVPAQGAASQGKMPGPKEILDTAISPATYTGYLKNVIDQTKQQWAAGQAWRDQEAKVAQSVIDAAKKGDLGTAAEILIPHLYRGAAAIAKTGARNVVANLTEPGDPNRVLGGPITPFPGIGGALEGFAEETAAAAPAEVGATAAPAAESAGVLQKIKNVFKGEKAGQPQAEEALRSGVKAGGREAGLSTVQPQSLRTIAEEPIQTLDASAKSIYRQIDQAAGTDFKALNERLDNTEYQIRQLTETEEDVQRQAALEKSRTAITDKIEAAKAEARKAGVDPKILEEADAQFKQARALSDLETKVFKNPNIVQGNAAFKTPETVDVNRAIKALQKMQDATEYGGSRLEQALGKDGAKQLLESMYAAQRAGAKAVSQQQIAKLIAKWVGVGTAARVGYEVLK